MLTGRSTACAAALLLACANALFASDTTFVKQGARVKVFPARAKAKPVTGEVAKLVSDTLVILPEGNGSALTFYRSDLRKIEVSQGKGKSYALIGLAGGVAVGAGVGLALCSAENCEGATGPVTALTAGLGGLVGLVVGALLSSGERWEEAEFPAPPPVALNVGKDGSVRLAFSLRL